jgi:DNA-binding MarR family transcriptional regulator
MTTDELALRARTHAALGDVVRLAIVDELSVSDRSPIEVRRRLGLESNLLAHHLDVLEGVGLIERSRSSGDGRRRYVHLRPEALERLGPAHPVGTGPALFVCTANSARSQLAAALWEQQTGQPASSAGTHPADRVNPRAVRAARRAGLSLEGASPRLLSDLDAVPGLVITVCDQAHEELSPGDTWLHWSVPDPVPVVTITDRLLGTISNRDASLYVVAQVVGGCLGAVVVNLMFELPAVEWSTKDRSSGALWLSEVVATVTLLLVIQGCVRSGRARAVPFAVAAWIAGAYWFTSSTSFANPAVTVARTLSDTFAGIAPASAPMFILAQLVGCGIAYVLIRFFYPHPLEATDG